MAVRRPLSVILFLLVFRWVIAQFQSRELKEGNQRRLKRLPPVLVLAYIQTVKNNALMETRSVSGIQQFYKHTCIKSFHE